MSTPKIEVEIQAKVDRLSSQFDHVYKMSEDAAKRIDRAFGSVGGSFKTALVGMASYASVRVFGNIIKDAIDAQDKLNDLSKSTGVAVEDLAGLASAADKSGSDLESIAQAINKLSVNIGKDPGKFQQIGVTAREPIEALKQFADVFASIEDPQTRAAVAAEALGKSWQGVAPLLAEGGKKLGEMFERGKQLSNVTKESADKADELNDRLSELKTTFDGMKNSIANNMAEPMTELIKAIQTTYEESGKLAALWTSLGALGAFLFTDEFSSNQVKLKNLQETLVDLNKDREAYNPFSFFGKSLKEIDAEIANTTAQIEYLKKSMAPATKAAVEVPKVPGLYTPGAGFTSDRNLDKFIGRDKPVKSIVSKETVEKVAELTASTKDYQAAMESLNNAMISAQASTLGLDSAQETLHKLMASPEWETYSKTMQWTAIEQASFTSGALSAAEAQKRLNDLMSNTPTAALEKAQKDAELLEQALSKAANTAEYKKIKEALDAVYASASKSSESVAEMSEFAKRAAQDMQSSFADFLYDPFSDGMDGMANKFGNTIRRMIADATAAKLSEALFGNLLKGTGGGTGLIGGAFEWVGNLFKNADGGVYSSPSLSAYSNGVYNSPQFFKFASGAGVFGEAGPEAIMPLKRGPDGKLGVSSAATPMNVEIHNYGSSQVRTEQSTDSRGQPSLQVYIAEAVADDMGRGGSRTNTAIRRQFGARPALVGR